MTKIAIASDDGETISTHFGRTLGFMVYEVEENEVKASEFRANSFTGHARGLEHSGHHQDHHGPILEALSDCSTVISKGMGRRIYNDLQEAGIETLITDQTQVNTALEVYLQGDLINHPEQGCHH